MKEKLSIISSFIVGSVSYFVGGFDMLISVFCTVIILDTLTGMLKAWNLGEYESSKFRKGFTKSIAYFLGVVLAVQIDMVLGTSALRDAVLAFFIFNEAVSIVENLGALGVSFPTSFTDAIKSLHKDKE